MEENINKELRDKFGRFIKGHISWSKLHPELMPRYWLGKKRPPFSKQWRKNMGNTHTGFNHWNWKGGKKNFRNYILILKPNHPFCDNHGYVREHRLVVETQINRYLTPKEEVHHINEIKADNRPENLMAFINKSAHIRFHNNPNNIKPSEIIFDGRKLSIQSPLLSSH